MFSNKKKVKQDRSEDLITYRYPQSIVSESFRSIRTNLSFMSPDKPLKSIMITSSGVGEGKSLFICNLSVSLAQNGEKVLLIDSDTRRPMVHRFFRLTNHTGLNDLLTGKEEFAEVVESSKVENLDVMTTGSIPPNPLELISSKKMDSVLKEATEKYDKVMVDAPPAAMLADASVLGNKVDGVIIVAESEETKRDILKKAVDNLKKAQANIIGSVLNNHSLKRSGYYYSQYDYYAYKD